MFFPLPCNGRFLVSSILLSLVCQYSNASSWTGEGSAGFTLTSGNSDSQTLNLGVDLEKKEGEYANTFSFAANNSESNGARSAESYLASYKLKYDISGQRFRFADARFLNDKFDSFDHIFTVGAGYGHRFINNDISLWEISAGLGYRKTKIETTGTDISGVALLGESDYRQQLTHSTRFFHKFRVEATSDNTYLANTIGLGVSMSELLSLKLSYDSKHNTDPASNSEKTDSITTINLVYKL